MKNINNKIEGKKRLLNHYFVMRHGESEAIVQKKIVSSLRNGKSHYGLTPNGKKQALNSAKLSLRKRVLDRKTIIYSSPLRRARETAEIIRKVLRARPVHLCLKIKERSFGKLEMTNCSHYQIVWKRDLINPDQHYQNTESPNEVLKRVTSLIVELEQKYSRQKILLVSHEDVLHILQTAFLKRNPSHHRLLKRLDLAEIRELILKL